MAGNETKIIVAGFGGQGTVLAGGVLAKACVIEGKNVTQMVSYGAEMRGGTANSSVVISDGEIASPIIERPDVAIILNQPSLDKFEALVVDSGLLVVNSSLVKRDIARSDLSVVTIDATRIAQQLGNIRVANMVALGAFVKKTGLLKMESLESAVEELFAEKKVGLIEINCKALQRGAGQCLVVA